MHLLQGGQSHTTLALMLGAGTAIAMIGVVRWNNRRQN